MRHISLCFPHSLDPSFVHDYDDPHLQSGSPAIDTGTNSVCPVVDLDGNARPFGASCDMGACEWRSLKIYLPLVIR